MVGDYRWAQRNGRAVADAIGERKKAQRDEPRPDCPSEKRHAQRNVKHAQNPLTSEPVGSVAEHQPAGERAKAEDRDQPRRVPRSYARANSVRDHMNDRDEEHERRQEPA